MQQMFHHSSHFIMTPKVLRKQSYQIMFTYVWLLIDLDIVECIYRLVLNGYYIGNDMGIYISKFFRDIAGKLWCSAVWYSAI